MAEAAHSSRRGKRPWPLTFLGLVVMGGLLALPFLAGDPAGTGGPDIVRFTGSFHPLLLHLPIGVFALILFQEFGAMFLKRGGIVRSASLFPLGFGTASAIVAAVAGFLLYHGHRADYDGNELAGRHLWAGLVFAVAAVFTFVVKAWTVALEGNPAWYRVLLFASVGVMGFASHDGASLTHGSDYLARHAPGRLRTWLGGDTEKSPVPLPDQRVVYADIVAPIIERRCSSCHNENKTKGKFRMDTYELLVKGGKEGPGIEPGSAAGSNIVVRMDLPEDDDEHMPPDGKPDVDAAELLVIKWWLDHGADPVKKLADFEVSAEIKDALAKLPAAAPRVTRVSFAPPEASKSSVDGFSKELPGDPFTAPKSPAS